MWLLPQQGFSVSPPAAAAGNRSSSSTVASVLFHRTPPAEPPTHGVGLCIVLLLYCVCYGVELVGPLIVVLERQITGPGGGASRVTGRGGSGKRNSLYNTTTTQHKYTSRGSRSCVSPPRAGISICSTTTNINAGMIGYITHVPRLQMCCRCVASLFPGRQGKRANVGTHAQHTARDAVYACVPPPPKV